MQECPYKRGDILLRTGDSKGSGYCYLVHNVKDGYLYLYGLGMKIHYTMVPFYFEKKPFIPTLYLSASERAKRESGKGGYREPIALGKFGPGEAW